MASVSVTPVSGPVPRAPHDLPLPGPTAPKLKATPVKPPKPAPKPAGKAVAKPRVSLTAAQEATLHAKQLLAPEYAQAAADAARQNQAINSYTQSVMQALGPLAGQTAGDYQQALGQQTALNSSVADALRNANPNADVQNLLNAVGAPDAQHAQLAGNLGNTFAGGAAVSQGLGALPIDTLRSQGLAATENARLQPSYQALAGRQSLLSALKSQQDARMSIASQQPKLAQDWLNSFQTNRARNQQLALETQYKNAELGLSSARVNQGAARIRLQQNQFITAQNTKIAEFNAKQTDAANKLKLPSASLSRDNGYLTAADGSPILGAKGNKQVLPGFKSNGKGQIVKVGSTKAAKPASGNPNFPNLTKAQLQHLRGGVANAFYGFTDKKNVKHPGLGYWGAVQEAVQAGYSKAAAVKMANRFYQPGVRGRPGGKLPKSAKRTAGKIG